MYERILTPRTTPIVTPEQLASFGRFDLPQQYVYGSSPAVLTADYANLLLYIDAATDEVEQDFQVVWRLYSQRVRLGTYESDQPSSC